jgi:uncharacterized membrane protein YdfJ with MMPL/SSD domain
MLHGWANFLNKRPWVPILLGAALVVASILYGLGVFDKLITSGGFDDPQSQSTKVLNAELSQFGDRQVQLIALFSSPDKSVDDPAVKEAITQRLADISRHDHVTRVLDYYSTGQASFVSHDQRQTYAAITLGGSLDDQEKVANDLMAQSSPPGLQLRYGGAAAINAQISGQINKDLAHAEGLSFPILAVLLILVFRSVFAALLPLLIGGLSILGAFLVVRIITNVTDVSVYAINVITLMGLGLAIDYISDYYCHRWAYGAIQRPNGYSVTARTAGIPASIFKKHGAGRRSSGAYGHVLGLNCAAGDPATIGTTD